MNHLSDKAQVRAVYDAFHTSLVKGDYDALADLLSEGFTRTNFNGQTISKAQWLRMLRSGELTYHSFDEVSVEIDVQKPVANLVARTISDATLYGERHTWRLELRQRYFKSEGRWLLGRSILALW